MFVNEQGEVESGDEASDVDIDDGEDGADAYPERRQLLSYLHVYLVCNRLRNPSVATCSKQKL